jgi:Rtf2 RING-finger
MGGDGGVIASNRRYLRGAGSATTTGDYHNNEANNNTDPAVIEQEIARSYLYCSLTDRPLQFTAPPTPNASVPEIDHRTSSSSSVSTLSSPKIVICSLGKLYDKEAAVEALLDRRINENENKPIHNDLKASTNSSLGSHIRGLRDLHDVRFQTIYSTEKKTIVPVCPVTGREFNGKIIAYALVVANTKRSTTSTMMNRINVVSEKAIQQMGYDSVLLEYGPIMEEQGIDQNIIRIRKVRINPPPDVLLEMKQGLEEERRREEMEKLKKKKKKRSHQDHSSSSDIARPKQLKH